MRRGFTSPVAFSHLLLTEHIGAGALVVDATAGNGFDTLFLAELIGETGQVIAFDRQKVAIETTKARLEKCRLLNRVKLIHDDHQKIRDYISKPIDGILFNLGYLPGGDQGIITTGPSTLKAVTAGLQLLKSGGLMVIVAYAGHPGGKEEVTTLLGFLQGLDGKLFNVLHYHFLNQPKTPPQVLAVKKRVGR